jgi:hypothetical protein
MFADADNDPMVFDSHGIPPANLGEMTRIVEAGYNFPNVYVLHELPPKRAAVGVDVLPQETLRWIDHDEARRLLPPPPASPATTRTAERIVASPS